MEKSRLIQKIQILRGQTWVKIIKKIEIFLLHFVMWYFYVLSPALSFSLHKERSRDVEVRNANQGGTFFCLYSCAGFGISPRITTSGETAARG